MPVTSFPSFHALSPSVFYFITISSHSDKPESYKSGRKGIAVEKDPALFLLFEIRFSGWERKQPGGMYCVRTVGAASALRARLLRSYVPLRRDRVKTCALTIHTSRRTFSQSDKSEVYFFRAISSLIFSTNSPSPHCPSSPCFLLLTDTFFFFLFLGADYEHVWDLLHLRLADLISDFLCAAVDLSADACCLQFI